MATTQTSLEGQYDQIVGFIQEYVAFVEGCIARLKMRHPALLGPWRKLLINPLKLSASVRKSISEVATETDQAHPFYAVMLSEDPSDKLSAALCARFPEVDLGKVKRLHDLKGPAGAGFNVGNIVGLVMAMSSGILHALKPAPGAQTAERTPLERLAFWVTVATFVYLLIYLFPKWIRHARAKQTHRFADYILSYTWIKTDER
jgi:hypothetical protein